VLLDQVGEPVQDPAAFGEPHARPRAFVERPPGRGHGPCGVVGAAERDLRPRLARPRVDAGHAPAVEGFGLLAVDDVPVEAAHVRGPLSAIVTSPAAQWVGGISRTITRTLSLGEPSEPATASVTLEISARMVSGGRPSMRLTSTRGMDTTGGGGRRRSRRDHLGGVYGVAHLVQQRCEGAALTAV